MTEEMKNEIILNEVLRKNDETKRNKEMNSFAKALKNGLGEEIKKELTNPSKPDKKAGRRLKRQRFWGKLKEDFKILFFKTNKNDNEIGYE